MNFTYTNLSTGQVVESETPIPRLDNLSYRWERKGELPEPTPRKRTAKAKSEDDA